MFAQDRELERNSTKLLQSIVVGLKANGESLKFKVRTLNLRECEKCLWDFFVQCNGIASIQSKPTPCSTMHGRYPSYEF